MSDKLNINNEMRQLDNKNRNFYDELTVEERKKFSVYLMLRWGSAIRSTNNSYLSDDEMASYYIQVMNMSVNKHFWSLSKHPKLQWLLLTTISPNKKDFNKHEWIAFKGKKAKNKRAQLIANLYPAMKLDEAELLSDSLTDEELTLELIELGWEDKKIKEALKGKDNDN
jgi:hypothetical protein